MRKAILCGWLWVAPVLTASAFANDVPAPSKHGDADGAVAAQLQKYRRVKMPFATAGLSTRERQLVEKLVEATRYLDEVFWQQSDPQGLQLYRSLAGSTKAEDQQLRRFLLINGGRYDLIREYAPFAGAPPRPPGGTVFPADLTKPEFDAYVARHPQQRDALYSSVTVVERKGPELIAIPYHEAYRQWLTPMSKILIIKLITKYIIIIY